ncbi:hypothetical protein PR202_gb04256 [Eleusine coracana subsp. coracana]|uniref:FAS1 domain-containing protein n=1 Tax=Eleusine coracana subsp. coracana TaxID=191504 RepID=A0AAV5E429_ELECO|nr:hypothetical protein PR202_gb04256 [Eleusine coracana subsp. coracana]
MGRGRGGPPPLSPRLALEAALMLLVVSALPPPAAGVNVTAVLAAFPNFADFARLLASTPVAGELAGRSSLTLLAVPNANLPQSPSAFAAAAGADIADVLRYHVLLEYLAPSDLARLPSSGKLVTTLFQTTGRAPSDLGAVNLTVHPAGANSTVVVRSPAPASGSNATVLGAVTAVPYNISVLAVGGLIVPSGFDLAASESRPPPPVNITQFEADEHGAGITVFVPTDDAFASLPATDRLQSLPAERKAVVLRFHVLHSYYPLGSLESIVNPVQPTLATEFTEAGRFTLNITRVNGSIAIDTGVVQASITRTVLIKILWQCLLSPRFYCPSKCSGGVMLASWPQCHPQLQWRRMMLETSRPHQQGCHHRPTFTVRMISRQLHRQLQRREHGGV